VPFYHVLRKDTVEFQDQFLLYVGGGGCSGNRSSDSDIVYDALAMVPHPNIHTGLYAAVQVVAEEGLQFV
jgi:hypothetical protein